MKKFFAVLMALVLVLSMGTVALAADETTGTITINNAVEGESYTIYKMFKYEPLAGDPTKGRYIAEDAKWTAFVNGDASAYLAFDEDAGTIKWIGKTDDAGNPDAEAVSALAKAAVAYAKANDIAGTTKEANSTTVEFAGLGLGYYAVDTSLGTICALTTTKTAATVEEKNGQPTVEKKIVEGDKLVDANNVAIGDTVNYQATITAGKGTVNYVLHDTMSKGLTFDGTVVVKNTTDDYTLVAGTDYEFKTPGSCGCTFEIDLTDAYETKELSEGETIVVTYSAKLNSDAEIGNSGNPNEIVLKYGNKQETTKDTVITYTTKLVIDKVDEAGAALAGAGFTLYKKNAEGDYEVVKVIAADDTTTQFVWTGLSEGAYKLSETTTPAGYNTIKDIEFTITCTEPTKVDSADDEAAWTDDSDAISVTAEGTFEGTIENKTGSLLPETGGIGTTIFYVVGLALMLGAAILLITKKRMAAKAE